MRARLAREEITFCETHADYLARAFDLAKTVSVPNERSHVAEDFWRTLCFNNFSHFTHLEADSALHHEYLSWKDWLIACGSNMELRINNNILTWQRLTAAYPCYDTAQLRGWRLSDASRTEDSKLSLGTYHERLSVHENRFRDIFHRYAHGRKFFVSDRQALGWAPAAAQTGDLVCILHGECLPYVVRELSDGYQLIGACYMHGFMNEEPLNLEGAREVILELM